MQPAFLISWTVSFSEKSSINKNHKYETTPDFSQDVYREVS
jgi:hypothetical protein